VNARRSRSRATPLRLALGAVGVAMLAYGLWRIIDNASATQPLRLGGWLVAALVIHDGVVSFAVLGVGWLLSGGVPGRARAYVQGALITGALVSAVGVFLVYRHGRSAPGQSLLEQNYGLHMVMILLAIAVITGCAYALRVVRDRRAKQRSGAHHKSTT
jgi:hypothetical protein